MDEVRGQPTRRRILDAVEHHPGASGRDVQHQLGLGWGETTYHLNRLVRAGALHRERGGWRDYYFSRTITWEDRRLIQALRSPTERTILIALASSPGLTFGEICDRVAVGKSTVSFHLRQLIQQGVAETHFAEGGRRYRLLRLERMGPLLQTYQDTFEDRLVDRFVESFGGLFPE